MQRSNWRLNVKFKAIKWCKHSSVIYHRTGAWRKMSPWLKKLSMITPPSQTRDMLTCWVPLVARHYRIAWDMLRIYRRWHQRKLLTKATIVDLPTTTKTWTKTWKSEVELKTAWTWLTLRSKLLTRITSKVQLHPIIMPLVSLKPRKSLTIKPYLKAMLQMSMRIITPLTCPWLTAREKI